MCGKTGLALLMVLIAAFSTRAITISGTVTSASDNRAVAGAVVSYENLAGTNVFSDTTLAGGGYSLPSIPNTLTTGILIVTASGFVTNRQILTALAPSDTVDVQLTPNAVGAGTKKIAGLVTEAGTANAVAGAQLVLFLHTGLVTTTPVDTVMSGADGRYEFDSLSSGRYDIMARKTGYLNNNSATGLNLSVADSITQNIQLTPVGTRVGTLTGKVTAADTAVAIANAKVLLEQTASVGGSVTIDTVDSVFTNANGVYAITDVPEGTGYRLAVSAPGYVAASSPNLFTVDSAVTRTENFRLAAVIVPSGIVKGVVTDSASLAALAGTDVVLRERAVVGGAWVALDSTTTAANGSFSFTGLGIGTYSLVAERTGYLSYTSPVNEAINLTKNPDTAAVAIALVPVPRGSLFVFVQDTANGAIPGASVSAIQRTAAGQTPQTYNGITMATGWAAFAGIVAGSYDLTVSKPGYNTVTRAGQAVIANASDSTRVTLRLATGSAKLVMGTVKTASGSPAAGSVVLLTAHAGGGTTLALVDTCGADGAYRIGGIPVGYLSVSLAVTLTGYQACDSAGIAIVNDTTTVNLILVPNAGVLPSATRAAMELRVTIAGDAILLSGVRPDLPLRVALYSVNGQALMNRTFSSPVPSLRIARTWSNQVVFLVVEQGSRSIRQKVVVRQY